MIRLFESFILKQLNRLSSFSAGSLLSRSAVFRVRVMLERLADDTAQSTVNHLLVQEALPENPLAAYSLELITADEKERALTGIAEKLRRGEMTLPRPLTEALETRLGNAMDGLLEMLSRLQESKKEICGALTGGKSYRSIEDMTLSAGDVHNRGRSVAVLFTDAGKLVYKPRDMRLDALIHDFAADYFGDVLGIPACIAFGSSWGVSEYIERQCCEGEKNARLFWRRMGGAAAVMKLLGSTDMHMENVTCHDGRPYILDLETILSPGSVNTEYKQLQPELAALKFTSPYLSGLLPFEPEGRQYSVLLNDSEDGCAPYVEGKPASALLYLDDFLSGYEKLYQRILNRREALRSRIAAFPGDLPVRLLLRSTQTYWDMRKKLYHYSALESEETREKASNLLFRILKKNIRPDFIHAVEQEREQLLRGDIPYAYSYSGSRDLVSGGKKITENLFERSPLEHALHNLAEMSERDKQFDLSLLKQSLLQYPAQTENGRHSSPVKSKAPISTEQALDEAEGLFDALSEICIVSPAGTPFFGYIYGQDYSFRFCEYGLANGLSGIAAFASAYAMISGKESAKVFADRIANEYLQGLERQYRHLTGKAGASEYAPNLGEAEGIAGILTGLALLKRYNSRQEIGKCQAMVLSMLSRVDFSRYGDPDRMIGMAGLLSALCHFPEYRTDKALIRRAADSLLAMKILSQEGLTLWRPFRDKDRAISGGGHGLAGIAEALFAAASILDSEMYTEAAKDAITFELKAYNEKFGTWSDLRSFPPRGYMHGYCSGAPGIGIMTARMGNLDHYSEELSRCAALARETVNTLPLNERDHLCCGNSAIVEYYLTTGKREEAGRVLGGMAQRKQKEGSYRYMSGNYRNCATASLFYGVSGIGYEMLRYAFPDTIFPII